MSFKDLDISIEYRSLATDVVRDFYTPVLKEAYKYQRAVGFFSSSSLICLTDGIKGLIENGGTMEIVASPRLSEEDIEAIKDGTSRRDDVILECLKRELLAPKGRFEEDRLNLLANLIAGGVLSLKIAFLETDTEIGMFHEKLGLMYDLEGNVIAFSGSMNESANAFHKNYEAIDVYMSWGDGANRVLIKEAAFSAMWQDYEPNIRVLDFPEIEDEVMRRYIVRPGINLDDLDSPETDGMEAGIAPSAPANLPRVPDGVTLHDYQEKAVDAWAESNYRGIFDMATGTGKTYTALAAVARASEDLNDKLCVFIVCPYQHLVEQWKDDVVKFGMRPVVCYSEAKPADWKSRVKTFVSGFKIGAIDRFCVVTTNATFSSDFMQSQISKLSGNCLIVVDEAHNFGSLKLAASLPENFPYRLALSATLERHGDDFGTSLLYSYFGKKSITYSLEDAINAGKLTPYYYHPVTVELTDEELEKYLQLTEKLRRMIGSDDKKAIDDLSDSAKLLLIQRARIVAGARRKISKLREVIEPMKDKNHMLVYCGATTLHDVDYVDGTPTESDMRQIDAVTALLGTELGMKVGQFTSRESADKRMDLKKEFEDGIQQQALIAIRCLDEGVNIPSIEYAFILASGTNPKEYIQRRGRVLRTSPETKKKHAVIYDFIALPVDPERVDSLDCKELSSSKSLVVREITRMKDFALISENPSESINLISELMSTFDISPEDLEEEEDA